MDSVLDERPDVAELACAELLVRAATQGEAPGYPELLQFPAVPLQGISLREMLRLIKELHTLAIKIGAACGGTKVPSLATSAGKLLEQWPNAFIHELDRYRTQKGADAVARLLFDRREGFFSRYLIPLATPGKGLAFMADAAFEFINGPMPIFVDSRLQSRLFGKRHSRWKSLSHVATNLGVSVRRLNELVDRGLVNKGSGDVAGRRLVDPTCVEDAQIRSLFRVHIRQAARTIGIPVDTLKALLDTSVFSLSGKHRQGRGVPRGDVDEMLRVLAMARQKVRLDRSNGSGTHHQKTIGQVLSSPRYATAFKAGMVKAWVEGRLMAIAVEGPTFRDVRLDMAEVAVQIEAVPAEKHALSYLEALQVAQVLTCSTVAVRDLVERGHLHESRQGHRRRVTKRSCHRFGDRYVSARELGDSLGLSHQRLMSKLLDMRQRPVVLHLVRRAGCFLRRSSLPPLDRLAAHLLNDESG